MKMTLFAIDIKNPLEVELKFKTTMTKEQFDDEEWVEILGSKKNFKCLE